MSKELQAAIESGRGVLTATGEIVTDVRDLEAALVRQQEHIQNTASKPAPWRGYSVTDTLNAGDMANENLQLRQDNMDLQGEFQSLQAAQGNLATENDRLKADIRDLTTQIETAKTKIEADAQAIETLTGDLDASKSEAESLAGQVHDLNAHLDALSEADAESQGEHSGEQPSAAPQDPGDTPVDFDKNGMIDDLEATPKAKLVADANALGIPNAAGLPKPELIAAIRATVQPEPIADPQNAAS